MLPDCADLRWISRGVDFALVPPPRFLYDGNRINDDDTPASLRKDIESAKADWQQKKQDGSVPGAGTGEDDGDDAETKGGGGAPEVDED